MMSQEHKNKHIQILKSLARYKFVTYRQMVKLGIDNHTSNLCTLVTELSDSKRQFVKRIPHETGREIKAYLTKKGRDYLLRNFEVSEDQIHYVKGAINKDTQDHKHRTSIIDIQISLDFACRFNNIEILFCDRYFDFTGSNRVQRNLKAKTSIIYEGRKSLIADMVFMLQTPKQKELYLLELENGKDTKKAIEKCINHGKAILKGSANEMYGFHSGYRTLWIFEYESIMRVTMTRIMKDVPMLHKMKEYFLFKPLDKTESGFFQGWLNLTGENRKMYY